MTSFTRPSAPPVRRRASRRARGCTEVADIPSEEVILAHGGSPLVQRVLDRQPYPLEARDSRASGRPAFDVGQPLERRGASSLLVKP